MIYRCPLYFWANFAFANQCINNLFKYCFGIYSPCLTFAPGEMAEWSNAVVLKTIVCNRTGGSNPSLSASNADRMVCIFYLLPMFYVYIIYSNEYDKYYIGQTNDFNQRLLRHNSGSELYTSKYLPWEKVLVLPKSSRAAAMELEKKLKNLNKMKLLAFIEKYANSGV